MSIALLVLSVIAKYTFCIFNGDFHVFSGDDYIIIVF